MVVAGAVVVVDSAVVGAAVSVVETSALVDAPAVVGDVSAVTSVDGPLHATAIRAVAAAAAVAARRVRLRPDETGVGCAAAGRAWIGRVERAGGRIGQKGRGRTGASNHLSTSCGCRGDELARGAAVRCRDPGHG